MNLDDLRAVQSDERSTDSLQPLPDSFYQDAGAYLTQLREERDRVAAAAEDPFRSQEVRRLTDEIETAEEVIEAIFERRIGKVVKRASLAASGVSTDETGLTTEEAELFEDLVSVIETNRAAVLETLTERTIPPRGTADESTTSSEQSRPEENPTHTPLRDADRSPPSDSNREPARTDDDDSDAHSSDPQASDPERLTIRVTQDVGEIFGVDERVYTLASEDVVTLPAANAKPLIDRGAAERIH